MFIFVYIVHTQEILNNTYSVDYILYIVAQVYAIIITIMISKAGQLDELLFSRAV